MNTPALETERLILRKFSKEDMEALFLILKDEEVNKFLPWYPMKNLDDTRQFYEERMKENFIIAHNCNKCHWSYLSNLFCCSILCS